MALITKKDTATLNLIWNMIFLDIDNNTELSWNMAAREWNLVWNKHLSKLLVV